MQVAFLESKGNDIITGNDNVTLKSNSVNDIFRIELNQEMLL